MEPEFSVTCRTNDGGSNVVAVVGELDIDTVRAFLEFVAALQGDVELDCRGLTFMDSAGMGSVVIYYRALNAAGGHLKLTNVSDACWKILEVTGLTTLLGASRAP
jgi:anti-sigma B factor antagonist